MAKKEDLTYEKSKAVMNEIMDGETSQVQTAAYLIALAMKGETIDEITGSAEGMRSHALQLKHDMDVLEIVGTGGDGSNSFNISTTASLVIAAGGVPVAKHGNRAASSKSGAADVLEALGVKITLTPEQSEKILEKIGIIDALESGNGSTLEKWAKELMEKEIHVVNMLGCHDGIPLLDLKGLIPEERIQQIIDTVVARGGYVKDLHGQKNVYYQVNATYYSALGEDDKKMLMARALQMFMPGKPQVWYLDLFAGKNDHEAVKRAGAGGHKEINRTNLSAAQIEELMKTDIVKEQLKLLHFRNVSKAFGFDAELAVSTEGEIITFIWTNQGESATLRANLKTFEYEITDSEGIYA